MSRTKVHTRRRKPVAAGFTSAPASATPSAKAAASTTAPQPLVRSARARFVKARPICSEPSASVTASESYVELVEKSFEGPVLRYSNRMFLLGEAQTRGISQTEARGIIAAAEHRADWLQPKKPLHPVVRRAMEYGALAIGYAAFASAWCWVMR